MTQYNTLNVKLSNWQFNKLKSGIKNGTEVTLNLIGNSNDETDFPRKILLTDTQVSKIHKAFANGSSTNIKFLKTQLSKMIESGCTYKSYNYMEPINLSRIVDKIANNAENLFNRKVSFNNITKTVKTSKYILKGL